VFSQISGFFIPILIVSGILLFESSSFIKGINYLIIKYKWQETFSQLTSAYTMTMMDYKTLFPSLDQDEATKVISYNLKLKKSCENSVNEGCWPKRSYYADGKSEYNLGVYPGFIMDNGVMVSGIQKTTPSCSTYIICNIISIDVNGNNGPNTFGQDEFRIYYYKDRLIPYYPGEDRVAGYTIRHFLNMK